MQRTSMRDFSAAIAATAETDAITGPVPEPEVKGRAVHVDGDYLAYYCAGNDEKDPAFARTDALDFIRRAKLFTGSTKAVLHLTASGCHKGERYLAATVKPYQGQRDGDRRPKNWAYLREWGEGYQGDEFLTKLWSTREADDGIAACAHYAALQGRLDAICTADKDMQMLPGVHLDWKNHTIRTTVNPDDWEVIGANDKVYGHKWFWLQMLMGDAADNIPGLEYHKVCNPDGTFKKLAKVGPKTAEKLLTATNAAEAFDQVWAEYRGGYVSSIEFAADRFVEQALLLWLRRCPKARFLDFVDHLPCVDVHIVTAANRMLHRVTTARNELDGLQSL